jgi:hypothetical protein
MWRVVGWIAVALVLFAIISNPTQAAATTSNLLSGVVSVGQQTVAYVNSLTAPTATGSPPSGSTSPPSASTTPTAAHGPSMTCPEHTSAMPVTFPNGHLGVECVPS